MHISWERGHVNLIFIPDLAGDVYTYVRYPCTWIDLLSSVEFTFRIHYKIRVDESIIDDSVWPSSMYPFLN